MRKITTDYKGIIMLKSVAVWLALECAFLSTPGLTLPILPDARREIQEAVRRSDASLHRKDVQGYMAGFNQDFHGESINAERFDKEDAKQNLLKSLSYAQSVTAHTSIKNISFVKGQAIIMSQEHTALTILGRRTHRLHTLVFDGLWRSVWVETKQGWQEQSEKQLTSMVTTDGIAKVVSPTTPR